MIDPFFNLSHRFPCLDRRRTGHAANRLPGRLRRVAQVRIGRGERLAFHVLIVADQVSNPQQRGATNRRYRNRRIGEFLEELDLAQGCSTGVPKILRAMRNNGWLAPRFETDDDRIWFLVRLQAHQSFPPRRAMPAAHKTTTWNIMKISPHPSRHPPRYPTSYVQQRTHQSPTSSRRRSIKAFVTIPPRFGNGRKPHSASVSLAWFKSSSCFSPANDRRNRLETTAPADVDSRRATFFTAMSRSSSMFRVVRTTVTQQKFDEAMLLNHTSHMTER